MENAKIQIEVHRHAGTQNWVYGAVGFRGGFAVKDYVLNEAEVFHGNYAFYNVLFNYFRLTDLEVGLHYDVQRAAAVLSFGVEKDLFVRKLNSLLNNLMNYEYNAETFQQAKQKTMEGFANRYKDGAFRARLKALEYAELNKRFTLKRLTDEIQSITFEEFRECAETLLVPGNLCVYIFGDASAEDMKGLELSPKAPGHFVVPAGYNFDPLLRNDAHIINIARADYFLSILALDFLDEETTVFARNLLADLFAELLSSRDTEVWSDPLDTSILVSGEDIRSYKDELREIDAARFETAKKSLVSKYLVMMESMPEHFAVKAAHLLLTGVYMDQYLMYLSGCDYETFCEICRKSDYKLNEAQIILRKESR